MEPEDKRKQAIERLEAVVMSGGRIPETEVAEILCLARDHTLLLIAKQALNEDIPNKERTSLYNVLQNAVERHESTHKGKLGSIDGKLEITFELKPEDVQDVVEGEEDLD
jgi:hypothetical protein